MLREKRDWRVSAQHRGQWTPQRDRREIPKVVDLRERSREKNFFVYVALTWARGRLVVLFAHGLGSLPDALWQRGLHMPDFDRQDATFQCLFCRLLSE